MPPFQKLLDDMERGNITGEFPVIPPDSISTQQLFMLLVSQNSRISLLVAQVTALTEAQREMVETWKTAKNVLRFIKFLGAVGAAFLAIVGALRVWAEHAR